MLLPSSSPSGLVCAPPRLRPRNASDAAHRAIAWTTALRDAQQASRTSVDCAQKHHPQRLSRPSRAKPSTVTYPCKPPPKRPNHTNRNSSSVRQVAITGIPNFAGSNAIVDVAKGIYRAFRNDESYQILHHTTNESTLSDSSRDALARMRRGIDTYVPGTVQFPKSSLARCAMCGEGPFENTRGLIRHVHVHLGITFQCEFCEVLVTRSDALRRHVKRHHLHGHQAFEKARNRRAPPVL